MENIDTKEVYERFCEEYNGLKNCNCNMAGFNDADNLFEYLFRTNKDFVTFIQMMVKEYNCCFDSSIEHASIMFALDTLDILDYFD